METAKLNIVYIYYTFSITDEETKKRAEINLRYLVASIKSVIRYNSDDINGISVYTDEITAEILREEINYVYLTVFIRTIPKITVDWVDVVYTTLSKIHGRFTYIDYDLVLFNGMDLSRIKNSTLIMFEFTSTKPECVEVQRSTGLYLNVGTGITHWCNNTLNIGKFQKFRESKHREYADKYVGCLNKTPWFMFVFMNQYLIVEFLMMYNIKYDALWLNYNENILTTNTYKLGNHVHVGGIKKYTKTMIDIAKLGALTSKAANTLCVNKINTKQIL